MSPAPFYRLVWLFPPLLSLLAPASAWCDVYKWTDERGNPVISNIAPGDPKKVRNFEVVLKERATQTPAPATQQAAARTEQMLLDRVETLERQLRARQYPPQAPSASEYGGYYPAPAPPPPAYTSGYDPNYYYPSAPVYTPVYTYATYPTRTFVSRPRVAYSPRSSIRVGSMHHARR